MSIHAFTDGACRGNPGPGGWGCVIEQQGKIIKLNGFDSLTTNNRMELQAAISALEYLSSETNFSITTDSQYVRLGITQWITNWEKNNWRTANKKPVKNVDLWKKLQLLTKNKDIKWHWVKGHSGHPQNELADHLANIAIDEGIV
tara:strand:+ start:1054 stop:1488 length:435 start_codon:yes stop_codon:yes gene_type:complete